MSNEPITVLEWWGANNVQHRIQVEKIPGSAHWHVVKDSRGDGGSWGRDWATEANTKPEFNGLEQ